MKKIFNPLFAIIFIVLASSFAAAKWYTYQSKEFTYSVQFPAEPTEQIQELDSDVGKISLNLQLYSVPPESDDVNLLYLSNATAYPKDMINISDKNALAEYYNGAIDGAVGNTNGTLLYEKIYFYKKLEGREIGVEIPEGLIKMRILIDENVVYMLETICPVNKDNNANMNRFFNSFKLN